MMYCGSAVIAGLNKENCRRRRKEKGMSSETPNFLHFNAKQRRENEAKDET
jgi:hypothetical protein